MDVTAEQRKRSAKLRWRQGTINLVLAVAAAWALPRWSPNFLVLGLFSFGMLRIVQGAELRTGLVRGGWTDIPFTPPIIGCWAAAGVFLQRWVAGEPGRPPLWMAFWIGVGVVLYALGRWMQQLYYARYLRRQHERPDAH